MKSFLKFILITVLTFSIVSCTREDGENGKNGINGTNGTNGNVIISGTGTPASTLGNIGDFYLDKNTSDLYGPKSDNGWGNPISLKGKDGTDGQNGQNGSRVLSGTNTPTPDIGNTGDWYIDLNEYKIYGPKTKDTGWGEGISLVGSINSDYVTSKDGTTLLQWLNQDLTEIDMQNDAKLKNITHISTNAFYHGNLSHITLPSKLKKIGNRAFQSNFLEGPIKIPSTVTEIGEYAFAYNQLKYIELPLNIKNIERGTFYNNKLTNIKIPNSVTTIGQEAFSSNQLTSVNIPNSVTTIGNYAFSNNKLTSVNIPNSVTTIGVSVFSSNQLTSVNIPNSVTTIGNYAFSNNKLTSVNIPNSVTTIGDGAFVNNHQLTSVTIPNSVTTIGQQAFTSSQLTSVRVNATTPPKIGYDAFYFYNNTNFKIYVPAGSVDAYRNAEGWSRYAWYIVAQ